MVRPFFVLIFIYLFILSFLWFDSNNNCCYLCILPAKIIKKYYKGKFQLFNLRYLYKK